MHAAEHLKVLEAIGQGDTLQSANLLRAHLEGARRSKVYTSGVFARR